MKKIMILAMALCMTVLSACSGDGNRDKIVELGADEVLAVGASKLTTEDFTFFLDDIKKQMEGTELSADESWETAEIEGKKAIDIAKERAYESAVMYLTQIEAAKSLGLEYTKEEMENIKGRINTEYFSQHANGDDLIKLFCEASLYSTKLQQNMLNEEQVEEKEIQQYFDENKALFEEQYMRAKHVLLLTQDQATGEAFAEDVKAEKKAQAEDILKRAKAGEDFDAMVAELSEDPGSKSQPNGYVFTTGEMVPEFENCVKSLGMDEIGFAETSYGYHVIKRLALDAESCADLISNVLYTEKFEEYIEKLTADYKLEPLKNDEVYNAIK